MANSSSNEKLVRDKEKLRRRAQARRAALSQSVRISASQSATQYFLDEVPVQHGDIVSLFWPIAEEIDCRDLILRLRARGAKICLPVVVGAGLPLVFRLWDGKQKLQNAPFSTKVPEETAQKVIPDLMVVPLSGFDKNGNRLGYGKGFYDRSIADMARRPMLVGLAFADQELEKIPFAVHDVALDMVVTENGVRRFN